MKKNSYRGAVRTSKIWKEKQTANVRKTGDVRKPPPSKIKKVSKEDMRILILQK